MCFYRMRDELANQDNDFIFPLEIYGDLDKDETLTLLGNVFFIEICKSPPLSCKTRDTLQAQHSL